jgi:hypothetical protein
VSEQGFGELNRGFTKEMYDMTSKTNTATLAIMFAATLTFSFSNESLAGQNISAAMMDQLMEHLATDEDGVIERLAQEAEAIELHSAIKSLMGEAYAGAWFSEQEGKLHVAATSTSKAELARMYGASASIVERSQAELEQLRHAASSVFEAVRDRH